MFESIFRALTRYSLIWWAGASVLLLVSACTTVPVERATPSVSQQPAAKTGERPAAGGLSNELVYEFLLGDVAARRDDISTAARSMAKAALWSGDRHVILRAFQLSMRAGEGQLALEMANLLLEQEPDSVRARTLVAQALIALDRPQEVFENLLALVQAPQPGAASAFMHIAEVLVRQKTPRRWLDLFERLLTNYPSLPEAHLAFARVAHRAGELPRARQSIEHALALRPNFTEAAEAMLGLLNEQSAHKELRAFAEAFLEQYADEGEVRLRYARILLQWDDSERSLYHFNQLVLREPNNPDGLYAAGLLSLNKADYDRAENLLLRHLRLRPGHDQTRLFLARLKRERDQFDQAVQWLRQVSDPKYYLEAQLRIAYVFAAESRFEEASAHLADIVPDSLSDQVRIYLAQEELLRQAGRMDDAYSLLNAALADLPDEPELLYARGLVTAQMDILDVHERDMRRLIALKPDHAHAYNALGYTLADRTDRYDEALILIEKALALKPGDPFILDSIGWVHYRLGHREKARAYLQQAIDLRPDAEIAAHLGEVLWMMERHDEARAVWRHGESLDSDNKTLRDTLRRLLE